MFYPGPVILVSSSSSLKFNITRIQSEKVNALFRAPRQCWTVSRCQTTSGYIAVLFIFIGRMPFLTPTLDNTDPLFALVINARVLSAPCRGGGSGLG